MDKQTQYQKIKEHGDKIKLFFNLDKNIDSIKLCKTLRKIEKDAYKIALEYCNVGIDEDKLKKFEEDILNKLDKILNFKKQDIKVFLNYDARGYTLKIDSDKHKDKLRELNFYIDWGGYGIIAPEIKQK